MRVMPLLGRVIPALFAPCDWRSLSFPLTPAPALTSRWTDTLRRMETSLREFRSCEVALLLVELMELLREKVRGGSNDKLSNPDGSALPLP